MNLAKRFDFFFNHAFGSLLLGGIVALVCLAIQYSHVPLARLASTDVHFHKVDGDAGSVRWSASLADLAPGDYYLSVGRPRSLCHLDLDGKVISTTVSSNSVRRENLLLGASFSISDSQAPKRASIVCLRDHGFAPGLTHTPLVLPYAAGMILQGWRAFTDIYLGVIASGVLILTLLLDRGRFALWFFAFASFAYACSLAHFPRLFLDGFTATVVHADLRTAFSLAFFLILAHHRLSRRIAILAHVALFACFTFFASARPEEFERAYDILVPCFSILTLPALFEVLKREAGSRAELVQRVIAATWLITQLLDVSTLVLNRGAYLAPAVVSVLALGVSMMRIFEDRFARQAEDLNAEVLRVINSRSGIESKLSDLGSILSLRTCFERVSVYADSYVLGSCDKPGSQFSRMSEHGYLKLTADDRLIDFAEGRGQVMKKALDSRQAILGRGTVDSAWYSNVPLGQSAVLNLSDSKKRNFFVASESHELVKRTLPALTSMSDRLEEYGSRLGFALESLRLRRGDGSWEEEVGCIFVDINGFDDNMGKYGDAFGRFVSAVYLPALCKHVRKWSVREGSTAGDSVYLICIADLMQEPCSVVDATYNVVTELMKFASGAGTALCRSQGYEAVRLQIGAASGVATVLCDEFQVRTSGGIVNMAARLQKSAAPGQTLVQEDLIRKWTLDGPLRFDVPVEEIKKTRRLSGCRVSLKARAA